MARGKRKCEQGKSVHCLFLQIDQDRFGRLIRSTLCKYGHVKSRGISDDVGGMRTVGQGRHDDTAVQNSWNVSPSTLYVRLVLNDRFGT
jgi:hypothetical protein